jgi:hypothetical protein
MVETIDLYEAIRRMRKLTQQGKSFSFTHATYNRDRQSSDGIRIVRKAILRPAAKGDDVANSDFKLFYLDQEINLPRVCWQPLLMFFEGKKVELN